MLLFLSATTGTLLIYRSMGKRRGIVLLEVILDGGHANKRVGSHNFTRDFGKNIGYGAASQESDTARAEQLFALHDRFTSARCYCKIQQVGNLQFIQILSHCRPREERV